MEIKTEEQPNIVFVVVDALRAKNVGCYGYPKDTTRNIDAIACSGVLFENCYSCGNATDPSFTAMFSGRHPLSNGIIHHGEGIRKREIERLKNRDTRFLPLLLKTSYNYYTIGLDWLGRWHRTGYDYYLGVERQLKADTSSFKEYARKILSFLPRPIHNTVKKGSRRLGIYYSSIRDLRYTERSIDFIKKTESKFFLMIHYWGCHAPYNPPENHIPKYPDVREGETVEEMLQNIRSPKWRRTTKEIHFPTGVKYVREIEMRYDGAISFIDHLVGRLVEGIQDSGAWDNTIFILTADHGESITEHGVYLDHHGLYDETIRVPLIMAGENLPKGRRIKSLVQHTDLVPTILDLLGGKQENFSYFVDGKSLMPLLRDEEGQLHNTVYATDAFANLRIALRTSKYKYIYSPTDKSAICRSCEIPHNERQELYDLSSDPEETKNVISENEQLSLRLRRILLKWVEKIILKEERRKRILKVIRKLKESKRI